MAKGKIEVTDVMVQSAMEAADDLCILAEGELPSPFDFKELLEIALAASEVSSKQKRLNHSQA